MSLTDMDFKDIKNNKSIDIFTYWVNVRHRIYFQRRMRTPPPWTNDPILRKYRFTNVRRMDDAVSEWLMRNWYRPHKNHPNIVVAATLARHFNLPDTLGAITPFVFKQWEPAKIKETVRVRKANGHKIFNGAYMVRGIETADKTEMVVDWVAEPIVMRPPKIDTASMENTVAALTEYWGFSSFMAGQVTADLRWAMSGSWKDKMTWAAIGPGSMRGINRIHDRPIKTRVSQEQFNAELVELIKQASQDISMEITSRMEAIDWQNCLCEFDKYMRALLGEGTPKQLYHYEGKS